MTALAPPAITPALVTRVYVLVREDDDRLRREQVAQFQTRRRPLSALSEWLYETEPMPGRYRAERDDGAKAEVNFPGFSDTPFAPPVSARERLGAGPAPEAANPPRGARE